MVLFRFAPLHSPWNEVWFLLLKIHMVHAKKVSEIVFQNGSVFDFISNQWRTHYNAILQICLSFFFAKLRASLVWNEIKHVSIFEDHFRNFFGAHQYFKASFNKQKQHFHFQWSMEGERAPIGRLGPAQSPNENESFFLLFE